MKAVGKHFTDDKAALSIETAIVMIVVIFVILFLIATSQIMYEQARVNAIAQDAAERAAIVYSVHGKDMVMGKVNPNNYKETSPYWRLFPSSESSRISEVKNYINVKMKKFKLRDNSVKNIKVEYLNYFIYKRVRVKIETDYKIPFGGLLKVLTGSKSYAINAEAEAAINEQAEMIRNVDMVADIVKLNPTVSGFLNKYKEKIQSIRDKIAK